jgi:hypothetical protein
MPLVNVTEHREGERSVAVARATQQIGNTTCRW